MFMNERFRRLLYRFKLPIEAAQQDEAVEVAPASIVEELQHLFAMLQLSERRAVGAVLALHIASPHCLQIEPKRFFELLNVEASEQQDLPEFSKLLLTHINDKLSVCSLKFASCWWMCVVRNQSVLRLV